MNRHKAIPTTYGGARFRSKLEARWAAMFDHLGWAWDYEPIELPGYIPDFYLSGLVRSPLGDGLLVECRPLEHEDWAERACSQLAGAERSGLVLAGSMTEPWGDARVSPGVWCAWLACEGPGSYDAVPVWWVACGSCGGTSLAREVNCANNVLDEDHLDETIDEEHGSNLPVCVFCSSADVRDLAPGAPGIEELWRRAGSEVQWKAAGFSERMFSGHLKGASLVPACLACLESPCSCAVVP